MPLGFRGFRAHPDRGLCFIPVLVLFSLFLRLHKDAAKPMQRTVIVRAVARTIQISRETRGFGVIEATAG